MHKPPPSYAPTPLQISPSQRRPPDRPTDRSISLPLEVNMRSVAVEWIRIISPGCLMCLHTNVVVVVVVVVGRCEVTLPLVAGRLHATYIQTDVQ